MNTPPKMTADCAAGPDIPDIIAGELGVSRGTALYLMREALKAVEPEASTAKTPASPTAGMNIAQRILHVGGRNNESGYVEFGSIQAVEALVRQVLRDLALENTPAVGKVAVAYQLTYSDGTWVLSALGSLCHTIPVSTGHYIPAMR